MTSRPVCPDCGKFAEYELRRNVWSCPVCKRAVTAELVERELTTNAKARRN